MTSVGSILAGAFRLVRQHPFSVLVWGLLYLAAMALLLLAMRPLLLIYSDLISQQFISGAGKPLDPQELQPYMARFQAASGLVFLAEIGLFAFVMVLFTATQRAVLRPAERGFFYLRLGGDELRLIGLGFFLTICLYFGMFLAMLVMLILVGIAALATGSPAAAILLFALATIPLAGATIYAMVRMSLAFPLTFLRRRFIIGEAWRLGKGRFWTLFGAYFVIALIHQLLSAILLFFALAPVFSELAGAGNAPEAMRLAVQHQMERFASLDAATVALIVGFALLGGLALALFGGAVATAARDLVPDAESATA